MNLLNQGLTLSLWGLSLTFGALGLFILTMQVLKMIFPAQPPPAPPPAPEAAVPPEVVAAIAIALAHVQTEAALPSTLGEALEAGRGAWWKNKA